MIILITIICFIGIITNISIILTSTTKKITRLGLQGLPGVQAAIERLQGHKLMGCLRK